MMTQDFATASVASELGEQGVDRLVAHVEKICDYHQQHIALTNDAELRGLQVEHHALLEEEQRIVELLRSAPPTGDLRRLRIGMGIAATVSLLLSLAGFAFTQVTLAPFRLGPVTWLISVGVALLTPFLIHLVLRWSEALVKLLTVLAALGAITSGMLLADIRGSLLGEEMRQNETPVVILDDATPQPVQENTFYTSTAATLRLAMLLLAFSMEIGAGIAAHEAGRRWPHTTEDWKARRTELVEIRRRLADIAYHATMLRNEPGIFATRFRRDFYRSLLSNATRTAVSKLLLALLVVAATGVGQARAETSLNLVVAIDLSRSVATPGPDGKTDFEKNVDAVTHVLAQVSPDTHLTVIGITDHSFTQPYILMSAYVPGDRGYFGERLNSAHGQLIAAWKARVRHLQPSFQQTDILGALHLASQIFAQQPGSGRRLLIMFSDMRQSTREFDLESMRVVPSYESVARMCGTLPDLHGVEVQLLGVDGVGKSDAYWQRLQMFWIQYLRNAASIVRHYSTLREMSQPTMFK